MADVMKYVHHLVEDLGVRPANTEDEYYAASEIEKMMREHEVETIVQEFRVPVFSNLAYGILFLIMALAGILGGINRGLGVAMFIIGLLALVLFALERLGKGQISKLSMNGMSQNVIARHSGTAAAPGRRPRPVVIIANYDSPKADLLKYPAVARFQPLMYWIVNGCMVAVPVLMIFQLFAGIPAGVKTFFWILMIIASIPLLVNGASVFISHFGMGYVQGANDNASGVAAMLGVLDRVRPLDGRAAPRPAPAAERYGTENFFEEHEAAKEEAQHASDQAGASAQESAPAKAAPHKKTTRRGVGVARAAGVIPAGAVLSYVAIDPQFEPEAKPAAPAAPAAPALSAQENASVQDELPLDAAAQDTASLAVPAAAAAADKVAATAAAATAGTAAAATATATAAAATPAAQPQEKKEAKKPRVPRRPAANGQVRSRFADLPVDYKRPVEGEEAHEETAQAQASTQDAAAPHVPVIPAPKQGEAAQFKLVEPLKKPAPEAGAEAFEKVAAPAEQEKKIESAADVAPAPTFTFDAEDVAMPEYDAQAAVDAAVESGRISSQTEKFTVREEDIKPSNISLVGLREVKSDIEEDRQAQAGTTSSLGNDPRWGTTNYRPQVNMALMDIPDPSVSAVDPYSVTDVHPIGDFNPEDFPADEFATGTFQALPDQGGRRDEGDPYDYEMPHDNVFTRIGDKLGGLFGGKGSKEPARPSRRKGSRRGEEEESLSDWLGVDDEFDAKKNGRQIGSWDNFDDDKSWKGGGTKVRQPQDGAPMPGQQPQEGATQLMDMSQIQGAQTLSEEAPAAHEAGEEGRYTESDLLDRREIREAILAMGDSELTSHEIWFVATGASSFGHAGIKAFLEEYKNELRGAFFIHVRAVGAGDLSVITREGQVTSRNGDRRLINIMKRVGKDLHRPLQTAEMIWADTEATHAMRAGYRAVSLMGLNHRVPVGTSWAGDTIDLVNGDQIETAVELVTETIRRS